MILSFQKLILTSWLPERLLMKIAFISLGCSKNLVDSQRVLGMLLPACQMTSEYQDAEVIFINTCGFIEEAKREAIDTILEIAEYKKHGHCKKLIVLGCLVERYKAELAQEMPEIDLLVPIRDYSRLKVIINDFLQLNLKEEFGGKRQLSGLPGSAYLRIADGCDNRCSYCAIPLIRKEYRSEPLEKLVEEAEILAEQGVKELVLIAQDTTLYGQDLYGEPRLITLLEALSKIDKLHWLRILYMYPSRLTKELIDAMVALPKVLLYFDLPLQHGSDRILHLMNRQGSMASFKENVAYIVALKLPYVLRTTMMVGFPGENDDDFSALIALVEQIKFHKLGAFIYSPEEDTPAFNYDNKVEEKTANARFHLLMQRQQVIAEQKNRELLNQELEVLVEAKKGQLYQARSLYQAPEGTDGFIWLRSDRELTLGEFYRARITAVALYDLEAEVIF